MDKNNTINAKSFILRIPAEVELDLFLPLNSARLHSEFYGDYGVVAELTCGNRKISIVPCGEIRVTFKDSADTYRNGLASDELRGRGLKDTDISKMYEDDAFGNSNWFNLLLSQAEEEANSQSVLGMLDEAINAAVALILSDKDTWRKEFDEENYNRICPIQPEVN